MVCCYLSIYELCRIWGRFVRVSNKTNETVFCKFWWGGWWVFQVVVKTSIAPLVCFSGLSMRSFYSYTVTIAPYEWRSWSSSNFHVIFPLILASRLTRVIFTIFMNGEQSWIALDVIVMLFLVGNNRFSFVCVVDFSPDGFLFHT